MIDKRMFINFDRLLFAIALILSIIGIIFVYSASTDNYGTSFDFVIKQFAWLCAGIVIMMLIFLLDYKILFDWAYVIYALSLVVLLVLLFLGRVKSGAQRWFDIGGISIQPSEFAKIAFIIAVSAFLTKNKYNIGLKIIFYTILLALPAFLLIFKQPDLGTALILAPVLLAMLYAAGMSIKYLLYIIGGGIILSPLAWFFLKNYQKDRLLVFLNPNIDPLGAGYTMIQSKIAIGSGRFFGKGLLSGTQSRLNFLPERHTDFIFSVVGEEWGFVGVVLILVLFFLLIKRAVSIAETTKDDFGGLIATGLATLLAVQTIINIGMTGGFMPVVGVPLPFISYGGSSLIATFIALGLLMSIKTRRSIF